jgi:hypothetical protein
VTQAQWRLTAFTVIQAVQGAFATWRAMRRLAGADDAMLSDLGVARCNIDWLVHHGRQR